MCYINFVHTPYIWLMFLTQSKKIFFQYLYFRTRCFPHTEISKDTFKSFIEASKVGVTIQQQFRVNFTLAIRGLLKGYGAQACIYSPTRLMIFVLHYAHRGLR
jgi:hypothetical protein